MVDITRLSIKTVLARLSKLAGLVSVATLFGMGSANAFDVSVVDENGVAVTGFRWMLEEDPTFQVDPGVQTQTSLALGFHTSYAPVKQSGECDTASCTITPADLAKVYTINVLPFAGYNMGAAQVKPGIPSVAVAVTTDPLPTAQIRVEIFHDIAPINGAIDAPIENNPAGDPDFDPTQFTIVLEDAGGRYGQTGGQILQDVYGNPLGTTYNADGTVAVLGSGVMRPDANGIYTIKNIPPAKYGIFVIPPAGAGWVQTSTIEGTAIQDAWVKANEPPLFTEFGPPGPHVFIGFVKAMDNISAIPGGAPLTGTIVGNHLSRPPVVEFNPASPIEDCWVGLTEGAVGGNAVYIAPCNAGNFNIPSVPPGTYQLSVWNVALTTVIAQYTVTNVDPIWGTAVPVDLGNVMVFNWFAGQHNMVFSDYNQNGFRDPGEPGIPEQTVNIRFRNGTTYQFMPTDLSGTAPLEEVFPFFHWMVAEVDFARYKATGVTYAVDAGGPIPADNGWITPSLGKLNPQLQASANPRTGNNKSVTMEGQVLTMGVQAFLGTTNIFEWGKAPYGPPDIDNPPYGNFPGPEDVDHGPADSGRLNFFDHGNGGISGLVTYSVTRAEDDPRYAATEEWEPGIPRVQLALYRDLTGDGVIDDLNGDGVVTPPDVDRYPLGNFPGPEDVDNGTVGTFDYGDAIQVAYTDSWDDSLPTGCIPDSLATPFTAHPGTPLAYAPDCYDGLRNFNQIRPGVFDGGYAFASRMEVDPTDGLLKEVEGLPSGYYIVESDIPPGYEVIKEEDKNVDFGVAYKPNPLLLPPVCVGDPHIVPPYLSFQTSRVHTDLAGNPAALPGIAAADLIAPYFAGQTRPLCNRKEIALTAGLNGAVEFHLFTDVPITANAVGGILNDLANEFNPATPNFGEKAAPSWLPVVFRDWTGKEILRVYSDEYGKFNARLPSTFSVNLPYATGVSPNMLTSCMNDSAPIVNTAYNPADPMSQPFIIDQHYNPQYSTFCYTLMYMPGSTTYLDTPVVPVAAFAGQGPFPVDCELPTATPGIYSVSSVDGGPFISDAVGGNRVLTIQSMGSAVPVPDPDAPVAGTTILRDYSFGAARGTVKIGNRTLVVNSWTADSITATVPAGVPAGQLMVTTAAGKTTEVGIHVSIFDPTAVGAPAIHHVIPTAVTNATPIQDAIDAAAPGDLILLAPGIYPELVIMHKPVQLQGSGANATTINASNAIGNRLVTWRAKLDLLGAQNAYSLLPGEALPIMTLEEGAGISVVANVGEFAGVASRIDGLAINSATQGGGILVNGYVNGLKISNNKISGNQGNFGGGIRVGDPDLTFTNAGTLFNTDAQNYNISIHHNKVVQNGGSNSAGGGISLYSGANNYSVTNNWICGNFSQGNGAGIGHLGFSNNGTIARNKIIFNQSFNQGINVHGGGIALMGKANPNVGGVPEGSGAVTVEGNLIQGNQSGAGHGGGIFTDLVMMSPISIVDNIIVNNVAGYAGGGIALSNTGSIVIDHNTIANNDSTASVGAAADPANLSTTLDQPGAGISSFAHTETIAGQAFSAPELVNNIIWHNRMFHMEIGTALPQTLTLVPNIGAGALPVYSDLAVHGALGQLNPMSSVLTDITGYDASNMAADPKFLLGYQNGSVGSVANQGEPAALTAANVAGAFDEGGNFIDLKYGPVSLGLSNYHLDGNPAAPSPAIDAGSALANPLLTKDYDGNNRPTNLVADIGADEVVADTDGDGVYDDLDNCVLIANAHQFDANDDGYGNICDADLNGDRIVNLGDYGLFRLRLGSTTLLDADFNNDGNINLGDYGIFRTKLGAAPGPSALAP